MSVIPILERFIIELLDYEELIFVLKKNKNIQKRISHLSKREQMHELFSYAKLFNIEKPKKDEKDDTDYSFYILNYIWPNDVEAKDILDQTLQLTLQNLEKAVFKELEEYLIIRKDQIVNEDIKRVNFLKEQSAMAKELNFESEQITEDQIQKTSNFSNFYFTEATYYLRGYTAIDMEISLIKSREYKDLIEIEKKIDTLKNMSINWVDYNIFLADSQSLINFKKDIILSVLLGLIIGIFYVFISYSLQSRTYILKK